MRWSPLTIVLPFFLFTTSTTAYPVSTEDVPSQESSIVKRSTACNGALNLRRNTGPNNCKAARSKFPANSFDWPDAARLAPIGVIPQGKGRPRTPFNAQTQNVNIDRAGSVVARTEAGVATAKLTDAAFTCDHILELDLVAGILEKQGGVCDQIAESEEGKTGQEKQAIAAKKAAAQEIIAELNTADNLAFFLRAPENVKTQYTTAFKAGNTNAFSAPKQPFPFLAFADYAQKTQTRSVGVAQRIDGIITQKFGGATHAGVATKWQDYLRDVNAKAGSTRTLLQNLKKEFNDSCTPGSSSKGKVRRVLDFILGRRAPPKSKSQCNKPPATKKPATKKPGTKCKAP